MRYTPGLTKYILALTALFPFMDYIDHILGILLKAYMQKPELLTTSDRSKLIISFDLV